MIERIMAKPLFAACRMGSLPSQPWCAVQRMIARFGIVGYDIRYDEGKVNVQAIQLTNLKKLAQ
jgi:hypothetical protein